MKPRCHKLLAAGAKWHSAYQRAARTAISACCCQNSTRKVRICLCRRAGSEFGRAAATRSGTVHSWNAAAVPACCGLTTAGPVPQTDTFTRYCTGKMHGHRVYCPKRSRVFKNKVGKKTRLSPHGDTRHRHSSLQHWCTALRWQSVQIGTCHYARCSFAWHYHAGYVGAERRLSTRGKGHPCSVSMSRK